MFTSHSQLKRRTGPNSLNRFEYLQELVTEYQDTDDAEAKYQVLANLGNFAYDPINYTWLLQLNVVDLFLGRRTIAFADGLEEEDEKIKEFSIGGLCNLCLDSRIRQLIQENEGIPLIINCLSSGNVETVMSSITTLMFLTTAETAKVILTESMRTSMKLLSSSSNVCLANLAKVFLQDYFENPKLNVP
ncbi:hypothetical protein K493DRAFT_306841 [Basidiobolus meristosporus CBS 931.73]|uniref:ARM repeat-containing protein n=1 Tax=Basidiobolus meristosporus CBS 931.73 TaxID=1314790 RepID=A0A1Y1XQZ0_9FUNG|nr:hypothetical protein K493DRAFT_306841 [Basidiobolus meristosporus CBS 931.73]|eukprot:ORX87734.1 hypothetical protein K493DRAFT_306841 [Basidiobolus meristosporus CBS 931.73]